jgi:hypothetical protein
VQVDEPSQGFDTTRYPGDSAMRIWRDSGRYDWVGFYLPAPCHKDTSWSGTRATLQAMGWGTAVIYVGQQTWGKMPRSSRATGSPMSCSARYLGSARGVSDAEDAIARTEQEGFPRGTTIFLDLEYMDRVPQAMRDYYRAWTARVLQDGRFHPGYYAHIANAELVYGDVREIVDSAGHPIQPAFWIAGGSNFSRDKMPTETGFHFAVVWQGLLDIEEELGGVALAIDVNVGRLASPSAHAIVAAE